MLEREVLSYWRYIEGYEILISKHQKEIYERATDDEELSELAVFIDIVINDSDNVEEYESVMIGFTYSGLKSGLVSELKKFVNSEPFTAYVENEGWNMFPFTYQQKLPFPSL